MKIYIASSWKNQHAVEMLTALLRANGHEIFSFVENSHGEDTATKNPMSFEEWVLTEEAQKCFLYDTTATMTSDLVIYLAPSGKDAAAECGMAYANGVPVIGLFAKGEDFGLMRKMFHKWFYHYTDVVNFVQDYKPTKK